MTDHIEPALSAEEMTGHREPKVKVTVIDSLSPSLATLGIKVENGEVVEASTDDQRRIRRMGLLEIEAYHMDAAITARKP